MARGNNTAAPRRRSTLESNNGNMNLLLKPTVSRQEVLAGIEFHWKNISTELHDFVMSNLNDLTLIKLIGFWSKMPEAKSESITAATCGCSWYMASQYMIVEKIPEARAMLLNGSFLQQVHNTSIEHIKMIIGTNRNASFTAYPELNFLHDGVTAISTELSMLRFLERKVPADYQRRMAFATQTDSGKGHVQDYINQISEDWDGGAGGSSKKLAMRRRSSLNPATADVSIEIVLVDSSSKAETKISCGSMTLKHLFKQYAEEKAIPLSRLRFSYNGGTLFLSSVGNQTPQELNMVNLDSILVTDRSEASARVDREDTSSDESKETKTTSRQMKKCKKSSPKRKQQRRASWAGPERVMDMDEHLRQLHSLRLSRVFAEAAPQFEEIRQKLNAMNLVCSLPKDKTSRKLPVVIEPVDFNPGNIGLGGKAGVSSYEIHVGESEDLYKVTKPLCTKSFSVDLHGLTRDEALAVLDSKLPEWVDDAMRGAYPWVSSGVIICGGGNQILSEAVDQWIKNNVSVKKAPKRKAPKRATLF
jgi:DNA-nicking Smr family endonuclease